MYIQKIIGKPNTCKAETGPHMDLKDCGNHKTVALCIRLKKNNVLSQSSPGFQKRIRNAVSIPFFFNRLANLRSQSSRTICKTKKGAENWWGGGGSGL